MATSKEAATRSTHMRNALRNNGLTLVLMALFILTLLGQIVTGHRSYNQEQESHQQPQISLGDYLLSGHFWEAFTENTESEFLQMGMFVILTVFLFQKGSPESKEPVDTDPNLSRNYKDAPTPVRRGGLALWLYSHSLSLAFLALFLLSFAVHAVSGVRYYNQEQLEHGQEAISALAYLGTSQFWFESFQNWQSEFLSLAAMVYLAVYLRERGSAESKPVASSHEESGDEPPPLDDPRQTQPPVEAEPAPA
jgi:hypothetical protein